MILLQTNKLTKSFGADTILSNINIEVQSNDRVALVGRNGSGKSTLLKMIIGELEADSGEVILAKDASIGYLSQHTSIHSEQSIYDELATVFTDLITMENELRKLEEQMGQAVDHEQSQKLLNDYDRLQSEFTDRGGYTYHADIKAVLGGLNFGDFDLSTPVKNLSGGQKTRLALGKLLLKKPEVLILDEPTNHLDIDTLTWLESFLQHYPGAILLVSHDRYFLNRLVNKVYEISFNQATKYVGNYSDFLEKRAQIYEQQMKSYEKQQKEIAKLETFVQKNIARATTSKRAKSRRKQLEKIDRIQKPDNDEASANFAFNIKKQSGHEVLNVKDLIVGYDSHSPISNDVTFNITRGESIALIGPNGIGKTTLLKTIAGQLKPLEGTVQKGSNVTIGYYDQEQKDLNPMKTVLDELWDAFPHVNEADIRTVLGNFLFSGEDVLKKVNTLSGGEKARLSLAKLMMRKDNFLIFDEPTNHLDLDSKEILESALLDFPGTILFVSHDRYFMNKIAERIFELNTEGLKDYIGDYDYYVDKKAEEKELLELEQGNQVISDQSTNGEQQGKSHYENQKAQKRELRKLERAIQDNEKDIQTIEQTITELESQLGRPDIFNDFEKAADINQQLEEAKAKLETYMETWETLHLEYETITSE